MATTRLPQTIQIPLVSPVCLLVSISAIADDSGELSQPKTARAEFHMSIIFTSAKRHNRVVP
jgi:hypothetical protein